MSIEIREVIDQKLLKEFIRLPARIHHNHPNWVPPIYSEEDETTRSFTRRHKKRVQRKRPGWTSLQTVQNLSKTTVIEN